MNARRKATDAVRIAPAAGMPGIELQEASIYEHVYPRHAHDTLAIGAMTSGTSQFWCRGSIHRAGPNSLFLLEPGEVHDGGRWRSAATEDAPSVHRMIYLERNAFENLMGGQAWDDLGFRVIAPESPTLAAELRRTHEACGSARATLERETRLLGLLDAIIRQYGSRKLAVPTNRHRNPREHYAVHRAVSFLHDHVTESVSIAALASLVQLHPIYLIRVFRRAVGLPPHAYQLQLRLAEAKQRLRAGVSPTVVAHELGFTDQSHFTKRFRLTFGLTPAKYQAGVAS